MSKDLATINCDSPIEVKLEDTQLKDQEDNNDKIELFKKLEFKQLLADIDSDVPETEDNSDKTFEIEPTFDHVDLEHLNEAVIHFEIDGSNYLKDQILKFGFHTGEQHIVINADSIKDYPDLIKWLEDENTSKSVYDAKKTYVAFS